MWREGEKKNISLQHLSCGVMGVHSISEREKRKHTKTCKNEVDKAGVLLVIGLCIHAIISHGMCACRLKSFKDNVKKEMTAAEGILRLTSLIAPSHRGKFQNNLVFSDLRVAKVMCSVSERGIYFFVL